MSKTDLKRNGWKKITKRSKFRDVPDHRRVLVVCLWMPGLPSAFITVPKNSRELYGKKYKTYQEAFKARPYVQYYR